MRSCYAYRSRLPTVNQAVRRTGQSGARMNDLSGIEHAYLPMAVGAEKCARASYRHVEALAAESPARSVSRTYSVFQSWILVLDGYEDAQKVHPSSTSFIGVCVQEERKDDGAHKRDRSL